jgi:hypothetical protein
MVLAQLGALPSSIEMIRATPEGTFHEIQVVDSIQVLSWRHTHYPFQDVHDLWTRVCSGKHTFPSHPHYNKIVGQEINAFATSDNFELTATCTTLLKDWPDTSLFFLHG